MEAKNHQRAQIESMEFGEPEGLPQDKCPSGSMFETKKLTLGT
jgi:hypothetical protein